MLFGYTVGAVVLANVFQKTIPVLEPKESGQHFKGAVARGVGAVDIAPQAFQRRGADVFVDAFPNGTAEEGEIGLGLHLALDAFLDLLLELGDFRTGFLHGGGCFVLQKCDFFPK